MPVRSTVRFFLLFILFVSAVSQEVFSQETVVSGRVYDPLTNEPIPFANVIFTGTTTGVRTAMNGQYSLRTTARVDSISASFIGYLPVTLPLQPRKTQVINFALRVNKFDLPEVAVFAGENPADILMRKVISHKEKNNRTAVSSFQYEAYNKIQFDINNITEKFKNRKVFAPFKFIFENIDSGTTNKKPFLPVFLTESMSDVYYTDKPKRKKEIVKATKISGIENNTISQFLGDFYQNINAYDNYIYLFGKGFVSPVSDVSGLYYKYYLTDSAYIDDKWCYKLKFKPRRRQELTFTGDMWIHDSTFAIKKINMRIAEDANLNFVEDLAFIDEFDLVEGKQWMLTKEILVVNIAPTEFKNRETMGFIARKTTTYKNIQVDHEIPASVFSDGEEVTVREDAGHKTADYWQAARHDSLSSEEKKIYAMVDTLKQLPAFQTYVDIITVLASGYKDIGPIDAGPIFSVFSYNNLEGARFRVGGRTNNKMSKKIQLNGYLAYGTNDQLFKYGGGFEYYFPDKRFSSFGASYKYDVEQLGKSLSSFTSDNLISSLLSRIQSNRFNQAEEEKYFFETDLFKGLTTNLTFYHRQISPLNNLDFSYYTNDDRTVTRNSINSSEVHFSIRYAYKEKFLESGRKGAVGRKSTRISLGSSYPITKVTYVRGIKDLFGSEFNYNKLRLQVNDFVYLGNFGYTFIELEAGKIFGTLPYPLLEVHKGNETYTYDQSVFNLMNYFEFVSDEFLSAMAVHHFGGVFLDRIPLLRKLKLREVATARFLVGSVTNNNLDILQNKAEFYSLEKPYVEAGVGIENILKFGRVDMIKRFSFLDHPRTSNFGIRLSFQVRF